MTGNLDQNRNLMQTHCLHDLNKLLPESSEGYGPLKESHIKDFCRAKVKPVFRNIEEELIKEIEKHEFILGCVAWLTSIPILTALQGKYVQFVVQQEDWLRPDSNDLAMNKQRELYDSLRGIDNYNASASWGATFDISPIRLSGKPKNSKRNNARMHHKFILFGQAPCFVTDDNEFESCWGAPIIDLVWTGSYNVTHNATRSLENGLFIESAEVAEAYYNEWRQILLSSFRIEDKWWGAKYSWGGRENEELLRDGT